MAAAVRRRAIPPFSRQALHAWRLGLVHPVSGKAMSFEAPMPADFAALREKLREHNG
jgi:23S rRNA pseudouridine1911/1915/1917 synthase